MLRRKDQRRKSHTQEILHNREECCHLLEYERHQFLRKQVTGPVDPFPEGLQILCHTSFLTMFMPLGNLLLEPGICQDETPPCSNNEELGRWKTASVYTVCPAKLGSRFACMNACSSSASCQKIESRASIGQKTFCSPMSCRNTRAQLTVRHQLKRMTYVVSFSELSLLYWLPLLRLSISPGSGLDLC